MYGISDNATQITRQELVELFISLDNKGMVPFSVTQITQFKTNKNDLPKFFLEGYANGGDTAMAKIAQVNGSINMSYAAKVNRERIKEGLEPDFVPTSRNVYDTVTKAVKTKGVAPDLIYYLFYFPNFVAPDFERRVYRLDEKSRDMVVVDLEAPEIKAILPAERPEGSGRQGLENEVAVRNLTFSSIAAVKINKVDYIVSDLDRYRSEIFNAAFNI